MSPLPSLPLKVLDSVRDQFRSYDGEHADTAREQVPDRAYWKGEPELFDESFDYIAQGYEAQILETDGGKLTYYDIPTVVRQAPGLAGTPISVVGRIVDTTDTGNHDFSDIETEYRLAGPDDRVEARAGVSEIIANDYSKIGDVVVMHGLVVARGVSQAPGDDARESVYLYVKEISDVEDYAPDLIDPTDPELRRRVKAVREN